MPTPLTRFLKIQRYLLIHKKKLLFFYGPAFALILARTPSIYYNFWYYKFFFTFSHNNFNCRPRLTSLCGVQGHSKKTFCGWYINRHVFRGTLFQQRSGWPTTFKHSSW